MQVVPQPLAAVRAEYCGDDRDGGGDGEENEEVMADEKIAGGFDDDRGERQRFAGFDEGAQQVGHDDRHEQNADEQSHAQNDRGIDQRCGDAIFDVTRIVIADDGEPGAGNISGRWRQYARDHPLGGHNDVPGEGEWAQPA